MSADDAADLPAPDEPVTGRRAIPGPFRRPPWAWRAAVGFIRHLLVTVLRWRIVVTHPPHRTPDRGQPLVVVLNHTSNIDAFLVADTVWRRLDAVSQPLIKAELFRLPLIGFIARRAGAIPVERGATSGRATALRHAIDRARAGATILLAPEGTITHDGTLLPLRHGAARIALDAGAQVLVVTHLGAQRGFSPIVKRAQRWVVVAMAMDLLTPEPDEDATALTGRIAATMLDRSEDLAATYPQADPDAPWWPPYAVPATPSATASENLERYQQAMADAVAQARTRMAEIAERDDVQHLQQRLADARARAAEAAEELAALSRATADDLSRFSREKAEELATRARQAAEELAELSRSAAEQARGTAERAQHAVERARTRDTG